MGSHLADKLIEMGANVHGIVRRHAVPDYPDIKHLHGKIRLYTADLLDTNSLYSALKESEATSLFHLAAQSFVPLSFTAPVATYETNIMGTSNLLEAVRRYDKLDGMQFAGSSEEYGLVHENETPIKETNPLRPLSPYGASKVAGDMMCYTHHKCYGLPIVRTRAFNHEGPRRGINFVTSVIAAQVVLGQTQGRKKLVLGNLDPIRDFMDVRDTLLGYMLAIEKGERGDVYNLASGRGLTIRETAEIGIREGGLEGEMTVEVDKKRYRPADVMVLIGDYSKAKEKLGWEPKIPFEQTMRDMIEYYKDNQDLASLA